MIEAFQISKCRNLLVLVGGNLLIPNFWQLLLRDRLQKPVCNNVLVPLYQNLISKVNTRLLWKTYKFNIHKLPFLIK